MSVLLFRNRAAPPTYTPPANIQFICEVAFTTDPANLPVWQDVSGYMLQFATRRGRNMELDRNEAGTASVLLDNRDRRFEPLYTGSPYYPNVVPMKRIRVRARHDDAGTIYDIFTGFVEEWPQTYEGWGNYGQVQVSCVDAFEFLNNAVFSGSRPAELTSDRVLFVLNAVGWPSVNRAISLGKSTVQAFDFTNYNALQHLQEMASTENGMLFVDAAGKVVFQNRHERLNTASSAAASTFGDTDAELPYQAATLNFSVSQVRNDIHVTFANDTTGLEVVAQDVASMGSYLTRSYQAQPWLPVGSTEASDYATYLLSRYKQPTLRIDGVTVAPQHSPAVWDAAFGQDIGSKVTVNRRPAAGSAVSQPSFVESVSCRHDGTAVTVDWQLSPTDTSAYWALGVAGFSELDTATRLAY